MGCISNLLVPATIAMILSMIMQAIYAIRPAPSRHVEFAKYDKALSKWYLELPSHLSFDPAAPKVPSPAPHILTLHMQYWCTVLLLHRPLYADCFHSLPRALAEVDNCHPVFVTSIPIIPSRVQVQHCHRPKRARVARTVGRIMISASKLQTISLPSVSLSAWTISLDSRMCTYVRCLSDGLC